MDFIWDNMTTFYRLLILHICVVLQLTIAELERLQLTENMFLRVNTEVSV